MKPRCPWCEQELEGPPGTLHCCGKAVRRRPTRYQRDRSLFKSVLLVLLAILAAIFIAFVAGCADPFSVRNPVPFHPPASYRAVWDSAQACTGIGKRFEVLHFFLTDQIKKDGQVDAGITDGTDIWLLKGWEDHPMVVKHEMIHALLLVRGHPPVFAYPCRATWATYRGPSVLP